MRLRREDDRLNLTALVFFDVDKPGAELELHMTSKPKAGLGVEDFLGAVIECEDSTGFTYVTLTAVQIMPIEPDDPGRTITAYGKIFLVGGGFGEVTLTHTETADGTVTENAAIKVTT